MSKVDIGSNDNSGSRSSEEQWEQWEYREYREIVNVAIVIVVIKNGSAVGVIIKDYQLNKTNPNISIY